MVWARLKAAFVEGHRPGSLGYCVAIGRAAKAYAAVREGIKNVEAEDAEFNRDGDVPGGLMAEAEMKILLSEGVF